jgi:hypothetical protein
MITVCTPRNDVTQVYAPQLFLGGTIDMGKSVNWQQLVIDVLDKSNVKANVFNPRRDGFPEFNEEELIYQINWELDAINSSDAVMMVFLDTSKSPVSMLELGLCLATKKKKQLFIVANDKFYRWHNVNETCKRFNITPYDNLISAIDALVGSLKDPFSLV